MKSEPVIAWCPQSLIPNLIHLLKKNCTFHPALFVNVKRKDGEGTQTIQSWWQQLQQFLVKLVVLQLMMTTKSTSFMTIMAWLRKQDRTRRLLVTPQPQPGKLLWNVNHIHFHNIHYFNWIISIYIFKTNKTSLYLFIIVAFYPELCKCKYWIFFNFKVIVRRTSQNIQVFEIQTTVEKLEVILSWFTRTHTKVSTINHNNMSYIGIILMTQRCQRI